MQTQLYAAKVLFPSPDLVGNRLNRMNLDFSKAYADDYFVAIALKLQSVLTL